MQPIRLFIGFEPMESDGFSVFMHSLISRASVPLSITPLAACGLPRGTNAFTLSRFLVPWLCGFSGHAIFLDGSDMLMQADIAELDALFDPRYAVQCVQHPDYVTQHPRKYVGTPMECVNSEYSRKNWASAMIVNAAHEAWQRMTPDMLQRLRPIDLLQLRLCDDGEIGGLPPKWNVLADEGQSIQGASVLHWTAGLPSHEAYANSPGAELWRAERLRMERPAG